MKSLSLRRQLLLSTNIVVIAVLALGAWLNYRMTMHELDEVFDAELAQTTRVLKSLIHDPGFLDQQSHSLVQSDILFLSEVVRTRPRSLTSLNLGSFLETYLDL